MDSEKSSAWLRLLSFGAIGVAGVASTVAGGDPTSLAGLALFQHFVGQVATPWVSRGGRRCPRDPAEARVVSDTFSRRSAPTCWTIRLLADVASDISSDENSGYSKKEFTSVQIPDLPNSTISKKALSSNPTSRISRASRTEPLTAEQWQSILDLLAGDVGVDLESTTRDCSPTFSKTFRQRDVRSSYQRPGPACARRHGEVTLHYGSGFSRVTGQIRPISEALRRALRQPRIGESARRSTILFSSRFVEFVGREASWPQPVGFLPTLRGSAKLRLPVGPDHGSRGHRQVSLRAELGLWAESEGWAGVS